MFDHFKVVSLVFVMIATINIGLMGLLGLDLVGHVLGGMPLLLKIFQIVVGIAGVMMLIAHLKK